METFEFNPFYNRFISTKLIPFIGKMVVSLFIGLLFLIPRFIIKATAMIDDLSILVGVIIILGFLALYYATYILKQILPRMHTFIKDNSTTYLIPFSKITRDRNFVLSGFFFGLVNCLIGSYLGINEVEGSLSYYTLLWGYFLAGFICGMAVLGIYSILVLIHNYSKSKELIPDYKSPDNCGGFLFLGNAILKFSMVIIIIGILIACYMLFASWKGGSPFKSLVENIWVIFPFFMAITITLSPLSDLSKVLRNYKVKEDLFIVKQIKKLSKNLDTGDADKGKKRKSEISKLEKKRMRIFLMKTVPLKNKSNLLLVFGNGMTLVPGLVKIFPFLKSFYTGA